MYFPKKLRINESIEIARLVAVAYDQFKCFEKDLKWELPENYKLVSELFYSANDMSQLGKASTQVEEFLKEKLKWINKKIPIGFIAESGNTLYIIFRGTKTAKEWVNNLNPSLTQHPHPEFGNVHEGFLSIYLDIRESLLDLPEIKQADNILMGGHSLGSAFASFALIDIEIDLSKQVSALYTFGSPRMGDNAFVQVFNEKYENKSYRIVNTADIVTTIPFPIQLGGFVGGDFTHVNTPIDFTFQADDIEINHAINTYVEALSKHSKKSVCWFKRKP